MRPNALARKIRVKAVKKLLVSLALLGVGAFFGYQTVWADAYGLRGDGVSAIIMGAGLILGAFLFCRNILPAFNAERAASVRRLPVSVSLPEIEAQAQAAPPENPLKIRGNLFYRNRFWLAKDWLIAETFWNLRIYSAGSLLWAYLKTEGANLPPTAIINTAKTKLVLRTADGNMTVPGDEDAICDFLHGVNKAYPWVFTDNTRALENLWRDDRDTFVQQVKVKMKEAGYSGV